MSKYLVVSGTNRIGSRTKIISDKYLALLKDKGVDATQIDLLILNDYDDVIQDVYSHVHKHRALDELQKDVLEPTDKWILILPEYNGTFPGVFKVFVDYFSTKGLKPSFKNKKLALVGVATGRAGNLRGLDHVSTAMTYLGFHIYNNKLPLSLIEKQIDDNRNVEEEIEKLLLAHIDGFLSF